jgi:hypothetical protein
MFFARYFPGLGLTPERLDEMTLEETGTLRKAGSKILKAEFEERLALARLSALGRMR